MKTDDHSNYECNEMETEASPFGPFLLPGGFKFEIAYFRVQASYLRGIKKASPAY
jgi:hypothetical protein